ncbi:hypothetical protein Aduo_002164 [Ancylostoma duodenale]
MRNIIKVLQRHDKGKKVSFGNDAVKTFIYEKESEEATPILQRQSFTEFVSLLLLLGFFPRGPLEQVLVFCVLCVSTHRMSAMCHPFKRLGAQ